MIGVFNRQCGRNVPGNKFLLLSEVTNIKTVTITNGEVSDIEMFENQVFSRIEADQDYILRTEERSDGPAFSFTHQVVFQVGIPRAETNNLTGQLRGASPCGIAAIVVDNNNNVWLVGWNYVENYIRGLYLSDYSLNSDRPENPTRISYTLSRVNECKDLPLDSTLSAYVLDELYSGETSLPFTPEEIAEMEGMDGFGWEGMDGSIITEVGE